MSRFSYIITWLDINTSSSELQSCDGEPYRSYLHWYFAAFSIRNNQPILQRIFNSTTTCPRTRVPMFINNTAYHKYILGLRKSSVWTVDQSYLPSNSQQYKALQPQLQCIDQSQTCTLTTSTQYSNHHWDPSVQPHTIRQANSTSMTYSYHYPGTTWTHTRTDNLSRSPKQPPPPQHATYRLPEAQHYVNSHSMWT